ncbi:hypothetical protein L2E82_26042 [Cichorium intybus]|uniref:Uncharacterized protein n=1 Tax=Cichorium intybus TaxID=13427 RepID=A0ACB9E5B4_CICIN|nr:hypothetical protein L2E82_26042 [Cichorium intybus]
MYLVTRLYCILFMDKSNLVNEVQKATYLRAAVPNSCSPKAVSVQTCEDYQAYTEKIRCCSDFHLEEY